MTRTYSAHHGIIYSAATQTVIPHDKAEAVLLAHHEMCAFWGDQQDLRPSVRELGVKVHANLAWELAEAIREARAFEPEPRVEQPIIMQEAA